MTAPDATWSVEEVINRCPRAAEVFTRFRMACVGCSMARFDDVKEAARVYSLQLSRFLRELRAAAEDSEDGQRN